MLRDFVTSGRATTPSYICNLVVWTWRNWRELNPRQRFSAAELQKLLSNAFEKHGIQRLIPSERTIQRLLQTQRQNQATESSDDNTKLTPISALWSGEMDLLLKIVDILSIPTWYLGSDFLEWPEQTDKTVVEYQQKQHPTDGDELGIVNGSLGSIYQLNDQERDVAVDLKNLINGIDSKRTFQSIQYPNALGQPVSVHPLLALIKEIVWRRKQLEKNESGTSVPDGTDILETLQILTREHKQEPFTHSEDKQESFYKPRNSWLIWRQMDFVLNIGSVDLGVGSRVNVIRSLRRSVDEIFNLWDHETRATERLEWAESLLLDILPDDLFMRAVNDLIRNSESQLTAPSWGWAAAYRAQFYLDFFRYHVGSENLGDIDEFIHHERVEISEVPWTRDPIRHVSWIGLDLQTIQHLGWLENEEVALNRPTLKSSVADELAKCGGGIWCAGCSTFYVPVSALLVHLYQGGDLDGWEALRERGILGYAIEQLSGKNSILTIVYEGRYQGAMLSSWSSAYDTRLVQVLIRLQDAQIRVQGNVEISEWLEDRLPQF